MPAESSSFFCCIVIIQPRRVCQNLQLHKMKKERCCNRPRLRPSTDSSISLRPSVIRSWYSSPAKHQQVISSSFLGSSRTDKFIRPWVTHYESQSWIVFLENFIPFYWVFFCVAYLFIHVTIDTSDNDQRSLNVTNWNLIIVLLLPHSFFGFTGHQTDFTFVIMIRNSLLLSSIQCRKHINVYIFCYW